MLYVSEGSAAIARAIERKLQVISSSAGLIFIGVRPTKERDGVSQFFTINLGISRSKNLDESTIEALVRTTLGSEYSQDLINIQLNVYFGVTGMCTDK